MNWYQEPGITEFVLALLFFGFYMWYLLRMRTISMTLSINLVRISFKLALRTVYFGLMIIALAGPSCGTTQRELKAVGRDIYIAVDLSLSMNAQDIQPSRIEKVKHELKALIGKFVSDKAGIFIFTSEAAVQCPLTYDKNMLNVVINSLNTAIFPMGMQGTDLSAPLELIYEKYQATQEENRKQAKVIVLISDGEIPSDDQSEIIDDIYTMTAKLKEENLRVFTVTVGSKEGAKIPFRNAFKRDYTGNEVITKPDNRLLKEIAEQTDGKFFEVTGAKNEMPKLMAEIEKVKGDVLDSRTIDVSANKYFYILLIAFILAMVDALLKVRTVEI